ncbi:hypothetical protein OIV83_006410 [Microbotryomycetes sp. JL201]|nr:hypothetical protein OIV83_006410 [Microbotryomycetes sp. JL201]
MAFAPRDVNVLVDTHAAHATTFEKSTMRTWSFPRGPVAAPQDQTLSQTTVRFAEQGSPAHSFAHGRSSSIAPSPNKGADSDSSIHRARFRSRDFRNRSTASVALAPAVSFSILSQEKTSQSGVVSRWRAKPLAEWLHLFVFCACLLVFTLATTGFGVTPSISTPKTDSDFVTLDQSKSIKVPIPDTFEGRRSLPFGEQASVLDSEQNSRPDMDPKKRQAFLSRAEFLQVRIADHPSPDADELLKDGELVEDDEPVEYDERDMRETDEAPNKREGLDTSVKEAILDPRESLDVDETDPEANIDLDGVAAEEQTDNDEGSDQAIIFSEASQRPEPYNEMSDRFGEQGAAVDADYEHPPERRRRAKPARLA